IKSAKAGIYRPWSFRGIDRHIQNRFFVDLNEQYHISDSIKQMVKFRLGNLLDSSFLDPFLDIQEMDLILCRNVFIYFSDSAVETVLNKFYNALSPLGYLLVGHAELYSQNPSNFSIKMFEESIAYQRPVDGVAVVRRKPDLATVKTVPRLKTIVDTDPETINNALAVADIKMQKAALNLLRQLPADTRMAKFGNLTASELILQFEQDLKEVD
ncbi:MAG: CheR family methyltransferase, partial [Cyanobacteria bacterium P01_A01_bin.15]